MDDVVLRDQFIQTSISNEEKQCAKKKNQLQGGIMITVYDVNNDLK